MIITTKRALASVGALATLLILTLVTQVSSASYAQASDALVPQSSASSLRAVTAQLELVDEMEVKALQREAADIIRAAETVPAWANERGDAAVLRWYKNQNDNDAAWVAARIGWGDVWQVTKCVAAIGLAVASTVLVVAKITKIKKLIKAAGGVKNTAKRIVKSLKKGGSFTDKAKAGFGDLGAAAVELAVVVLGIDSIQDNCS